MRVRVSECACVGSDYNVCIGWHACVFDLVAHYKVLIQYAR